MISMKHIKTIFPGNLNSEREHGIGCGECQTSCQSACKTSCTVANQNCEQADILQATPFREKPLTSRIRKISKASA
jgi:predicted ribosomally synthesized six-cysteine peptide SCIFF